MIEQQVVYFIQEVKIELQLVNFIQEVKIEQQVLYFVLNYLNHYQFNEIMVKVNILNLQQVLDLHIPFQLQ